ncbi:MAG: hypothetical protein ACRBK7_21895 [Acidimicrobiales bacterium]
MSDDLFDPRPAPEITEALKTLPDPPAATPAFWSRLESAIAAGSAPTLDVPRPDVPEIHVPVIHVPRLDVPSGDAAELNVPKRRSLTRPLLAVAAVLLVFGGGLALTQVVGEGNRIELSSEIEDGALADVTTTLAGVASAGAEDNSGAEATSSFGGQNSSTTTANNAEEPTETATLSSPPSTAEATTTTSTTSTSISDQPTTTAAQATTTTAEATTTSAVPSTSTTTEATTTSATANLQLPSPVLGPLVPEYTYSQVRLYVVWDRVPGATGYDKFYSLDGSDFVMSQMFTEEADVTHTGPPGSQYCLRVLATSETRPASEPSVVCSVSAAPMNPTWSVSTAYEGIGPEGATMDIQWTDIGPAARYAVRMTWLGQQGEFRTSTAQANASIDLSGQPDTWCLYIDALDAGGSPIQAYSECGSTTRG